MTLKNEETDTVNNEERINLLPLGVQKNICKCNSKWKVNVKLSFFKLICAIMWLVEIAKEINCVFLIILKNGKI